jgi:niacin transporter
MNRQKLYLLTVSAMLCAVSIVIPMFSPFKIVLEPASFTLASHVAIFLAMFISPVCAISVAAGATAGFLLGGFPIVIVMRAASHLIFAAVGSVLIRRNPELIEKKSQAVIFAVSISIMHAISEILVVMPFYFNSQMPGSYYAKGFMFTIIGLVGVGTVAHSLVDFIIARAVWASIRKTALQQLGTRKA